MTNPRSLDPVDATANLDLGALSELLGFHLRMAQVAMHRDFTATLSHLDLTQRQWAVMQLIAANPGVSQADLATALDTDRATMMATIDRLDERGFLLRERSKADRRRSELSLTLRGRAMLNDAQRSIDKHENRFHSLFSGPELETLLEALNRIKRAGLG